MFKYIYGEKLFPNTNKTAIFLAGSASAEFLADIALCPFESIKVRMQTTLPPFANTMREGMSKVIKEEGYAGYDSSFFLIFQSLIVKQPLQRPLPPLGPPNSLHDV